MVKAHLGWRLFLVSKGIVSAQAKNRDLIEYALCHPKLAAQIEHMLQAHTAAAPTASAATLMLAARVEALLREYAARKPRIRVKAMAQPL